MHTTDQAVEKAKKTEQAAHDGMVALFAQLVAFEKDKTNPFTYFFKSDGIINMGSSNRASIEVTFPAAKDARYKTVKVYYTLKRKGYSVYGDYKTFVRIESDHWETKHKHNWTFETKDLATKVHAKVGEMVRDLKERDAHRKQQLSDSEQVQAFLTKKFGDRPEQSVYATGGRGSAYLKEGKMEYRLESHTFSIELGGLTEDQFDRVLAIKNEAKADGTN